jgi:hypothetical protein
MLMTTPPAAHRRPLPSAVKLLLPVWGKRFVEQFLEFCLPTLMAPGNIPALARMLPCEMVVMTNAADEPALRRHPLWQQLGRICRATVKHIDDLITDGNHSTTITLAYAQLVREAGDEMLDTCFIFLVSDYVVADGSLRTVLARLMDGASGVLAGNFQVIAEDAVDSLRVALGPAPAALAIPPRKLVKWAFSHLHPATVANIVNYRLSHNAHTNRLFWRVDENTIIGRFYLMHMIGIRPEVTDFVVGSSCDYSFIPEMCPSGKVVALADSDDYLVVEMQPHGHEARHLRWGPINPTFLAQTLSEWTTENHRQNIQHTLVYHAMDISDSIAGTIVEADAFLAKVDGKLTTRPQPHRGHPYWLGAVAAHRAATGQKLSPEEWDFVLGGAKDERSKITRFFWKFRRKMYGFAPTVRLWHPYWPDFRLPLSALKDVLDAGGELLVVSEAADTYTHWLWRTGTPGRSLEVARLLSMPEAELKVSAGKYAACLLVTTEGYMDGADKITKRIASLLQSAASLFVLIINDRQSDPRAFGGRFAHNSSRFINLSMWVAEVRYVRSGSLRWMLRRRLALLGRRTTNVRPVEAPYFVVAGSIASVLNGLLNVILWRATDYPPRRGFCSSIFLVLRPTVALPPVTSLSAEADARNRDSLSAAIPLSGVMEGTRGSPY